MPSINANIMLAQYDGCMTPRLADRLFLILVCVEGAHLAPSRQVIPE
jgi:hypothetical protein